PERERLARWPWSPAPARRARRIPTGIVDLIAHARRELQYGACRTRIWLLRVHQVKVATKTITRICDDLGLPPVQRPKRRRGGRQLKLFEEATPGESVQVDVKVIKLGNTKAYQYTACDDCTRFRVLRLYSAAEHLLQPRLRERGHRGVPIPHPEAADRQRFGVLIHVHARGRTPW